MISWIQENQDWLWQVGILSLIGSVIMLVAISWLVTRIPADYFTHDRATRGAMVVRNPILRMVLKILRNLIGGVLLMAGVVLLALPGPGVPTILLGLTLMDFPGKPRLLRWLVSRRFVRVSLDWVRTHADKEPLRWEDDQEEHKQQRYK